MRSTVVKRSIAVACRKTSVGLEDAFWRDLKEIAAARRMSICDLVAAIVDAHTHLLPGRLAQKVRTFLERHLPGPLAYPLDHEAVLERLHADGVQEVWSFPYAHRPGTARAMNEASAETVRRFARGPVTVTGGATVHPGDDDPAGIVAEARIPSWASPPPSRSSCRTPGR